MTEEFMESILTIVLCATLFIGILTVIFGLEVLWITLLICTIVSLGTALVTLGVLLAKYNERAK